MKVSKLCDKEFRIILSRKLNELQENTELNEMKITMPKQKFNNKKETIKKIKQKS